MWDLFELDRHNGGYGKRHELGEALSRLDAGTLTKLRDWLDENSEQAIERYGDDVWLAVRVTVGLSALLKPLPARMRLPEAKDGLPLQFSAWRTDGKVWDLNIPIRAELLRQMRRKFGEREYARRLGVSRKVYRRLRATIEREGFSLDRFTPDVLWRIVYGNKRGPKDKR